MAKQSFSLALLSLLCTLPLQAQQTGSEQTLLAEPPREIAVTGDAHSSLPSDTALVTFLIDETGKTTQEAITLVDQKTEAIKKTIDSLNLNPTYSIRGEQLLSGSGDRGNLSKTSAPRIQRFFGVKTQKLARVGSIVDSGLSSGASMVANVDYLVENAGEIQLKTIKLASDRAKEKAKLLAESLGVKLGKLLSAATTEDPQGEVLRQQMQIGKDASQFSERELNVYATLRFAVE